MLGSPGKPAGCWGRRSLGIPAHTQNLARWVDWVVGAVVESAVFGLT